MDAEVTITCLEARVDTVAFRSRCRDPVRYGFDVDISVARMIRADTVCVIRRRRDGDALRIDVDGCCGIGSFCTFDAVAAVVGVLLQTAAACALPAPRKNISRTSALGIRLRLTVM